MRLYKRLQERFENWKEIAQETDEDWIKDQITDFLEKEKNDK